MNTQRKSNSSNRPYSSPPSSTNSAQSMGSTSDRLYHPHRQFSFLSGSTHNGLRGVRAPPPYTDSIKAQNGSCSGDSIERADSVRSNWSGHHPQPSPSLASLPSPEPWPLLRSSQNELHVVKRTNVDIEAQTPYSPLTSAQGTHVHTSRTRQTVIQQNSTPESGRSPRSSPTTHQRTLNKAGKRVAFEAPSSNGTQGEIQTFPPSGIDTGRDEAPRRHSKIH
ncbi:hypothetical protein M231_06115 [Tremella mesenterica]|uniref:Uncharacterized protein n=1 Tax=Tremella mesenterica TaxID=5217 RepID=A0A4Q1BEK2_TREME|nr:hypothetical protein M231_06115 [Tremella mesenterica]